MLGLYEVFYAGYLFLRLISAAIVIYCVLSWFRHTFRAFYTLRRFIQPFVSPFQRLSLRVMRYFQAPIDFTCLFALIGYQILGRLWWQLYYLLARAL
ncbi:MAG: YggT family protein [Clostridia bacterium]|nr:YggT family protein [Clostridia bacterium]